MMPLAVQVTERTAELLAKATTRKTSSYHAEYCCDVEEWSGLFTTEVQRMIQFYEA